MSKHTRFISVEPIQRDSILTELDVTGTKGQPIDGLLCKVHKCPCDGANGYVLTVLQDDMTPVYNRLVHFISQYTRGGLYIISLDLNPKHTPTYS